MTSPDLQIYPDERHKIQYVYEKLSRQFEFTPIKGEIGFLVTVTWQQLYEGAAPTGVWMPGIEIYGRNKAEQEHDHDRHKWGVVRGLADGQKGYVREDGTKHEEPLKKIILP
jgi:hypothetical protein